VTIGIGSQGSPTDKAEASATTPAGSAFVRLSTTWTPSADRSDAHFFVRAADKLINPEAYIDGVMVVLQAVAVAYSDTGPGGGGSFVSTIGVTAAEARYGIRSLVLTTPATATAGVVGDLTAGGGYFVSGQVYSLSLWLRASDALPYKVGIGANKGDGTWDEASTTGTLTADTWTQITLTWTPSADRSSATARDVVIFVYQTDATARSIWIDGIRVIPGSSADAFEEAHWILPAVSAIEGEHADPVLGTATLSGTGLAALTRLNRLFLSRHYVRPTMASPFYEYVVGVRGDLAEKTVAEVIVDTGEGGAEDLSPYQLSRESIVNVQPVRDDDATEYYSDAASVARYGERPATLIDGDGIYPAGSSIPDQVGPALIARYKDPRARPQLRRSQKFPNLLARQVDDLIAVSAARLNVYAQRYLIVIWELEITEAGLWWRARYGLEELP
jgi:hypothetical protein